MSKSSFSVNWSISWIASGGQKEKDDYLGDEADDIDYTPADASYFGGFSQVSDLEEGGGKKPSQHDKNKTENRQWKWIFLHLRHDPRRVHSS